MLTAKQVILMDGRTIVANINDEDIIYNKDNDKYYSVINVCNNYYFYNIVVRFCGNDWYEIEKEEILLLIQTLGGLIMSCLEQLNDNLKTKEGLRYLISVAKVYSLEYLSLFEVVDWLRLKAERLDCVVK